MGGSVGGAGDLQDVIGRRGGPDEIKVPARSRSVRFVAASVPSLGASETRFQPTGVSRGHLEDYTAQKRHGF